MLIAVAAILYWFLRQKDATRSRQRLAVAALIAGPVLGITAGVLELTLGDVDPLDRWHLFVPVVCVSTIAGVIGSILILVFAHRGSTGS